MIYFIPIKRESIRENPDAGKTFYYIPGRKTTTEEYKVYYVNGLESHRELISRNIIQNVQKVYSLTPQPKYLYEYEDIKVKCHACMEEFSHFDIVTNMDQDYYNEITCPKCGEPDCCLIEYEELNDILQKDPRD